MKRVSTDHLDRIVEFVRARREDDVSLGDVVALAELTVESLSSFFRSLDMAVYRELSEIATFITNMKAEIGRLQPNDLKQSRIPAAGMELDAIVKATEKATDTIMGAAEEVMAADPAQPGYKALVDERMMLIFEACSFQDITGQRVAKVIETLQHIEARVSRFAEAINAADAEGYMTDEERRREERKVRNILHGPQLDGAGADQSQVDALFSKPEGEGGSQAAIDALFK
ncbi:protein phosphatase CheZ [Phreatobacter sp. AB_2022a]|uniref:protein phosphatase CheZ n=1 Tax=Phreatobacter sp. AB_2022a TaxID=3003134 RepID=UPI002286FAA0|nr:protein phosphatase CheZ [Phreatobacter sp. AB_2022a]MCZ0737824.1 protein phosphatase CheZ [Phreatobacter sp. AB_2022a]